MEILKSLYELELLIGLVSTIIFILLFNKLSELNKKLIVKSIRVLLNKE